MINKRNSLCTFITMFACTLLCNLANAQLRVYGQLRTRTEYRDGQGSPLPKDSKPAIFVSQRTRLNLDYSTYRLKFGVALQDVRVWGQDVSTINRTTTQNNNGLMLHEAWAEISFTDTTNKKESVALKLGRQEMIFDDQRLIGNLDWLQQARHHDAAILKYTTSAWNIQAGVAYNQNKENNSGTVYIPVPPGNYPANTNGGSMYKSFEFGYANRKLKSGNVSFLIFADQFNKYTLDSANVKVWGTGTWTRLTSGIYFNNRFNKWVLTASAYYQGGKTADNQKLSAALVSANLNYDLTKKFTVGSGVDYTSGGTSGTTVHAFDPLYGTPHKFWGLMDYFYAANSFGNKGLVDYYIKSGYTFSGKLKVNADLHQFVSASKVTSAGNKDLSRNFGTEADIVANYILTGPVSFEAGYSHFFSTATLTSPTVKNVPNANKNNSWAYLMVIIKPGILTK